MVPMWVKVNDIATPMGAKDAEFGIKNVNITPQTIGMEYTQTGINTLPELLSLYLDRAINPAMT